MEVAIMSTVIHWGPLREMAEMQGAMNRLVDDAWRTFLPTVQANTSPILDVYESTEGYTLLADIPGATQENINITLNQNVLSLSVEIPKYTLQDGQRALMVERPSGQFTRSITLPRPVDTE